MHMIKDFEANEELYGEKFLIANVLRGVNNSGTPYLSITLQDKTGTIEAKKWEVENNDYDICVPGNVIRLDGVTYLYREQMQIKIFKILLVKEDEYRLDDFIQRPPYDLKNYENELEECISFVEDKDYHALLVSLFDDYKNKFISYPAASKNHHDFSGGLLVHTIHMTRLAKAIQALYPSLDIDILLTGVLLHDLGKVIEFSGPILSKYTNEGRLVGHISIGHAIISERAKALNIDEEARIIIEHLILSHHGKKDYGSPVEPMIKEAVVLNMIDDLDARMDMLEKALHEVKGGEWSQKIFAFDDRMFYQPKKKR